MYSCNLCIFWNKTWKLGLCTLQETLAGNRGWAVRRFINVNFFRTSKKNFCFRTRQTANIHTDPRLISSIASSKLLANYEIWTECQSEIETDVMGKNSNWIIDFPKKLNPHLKYIKFLSYKKCLKTIEKNMRFTYRVFLW